MSSETTEDEKAKKPKTITIHVDRNKFKVEAGTLTGAQIRALAHVSDQFDLYLVVTGPGDDKLIGDSEKVELKDGMHFFTAPRSIAPGRGA